MLGFSCTWACHCYQQRPDLPVELWFPSFLIYSKKSFSAPSIVFLSLLDFFLSEYSTHYTGVSLSLERKKERNKHSWHIFFLHFLLYFSISIQHNSLKCGQHLLSPFPYPVLCIYFNFVKISCTKMHTVPTELSCASIWVLACSSLGQVANVKSWPSLAWLHSGQSPFSSTWVLLVWWIICFSIDQAGGYITQIHFLFG